MIISGFYYGSTAVGAYLGSTPIQGGTAELPIQIVGSRGEMNFVRAGARTSSNNLQVARTEHYIGNADVSELYVAFNDYYILQDNTGEANGDGYTARFNIEYNGLSVRGAFSGSRDGIIPAGSALVLSDPILPSSFGLEVFPAGAQFWIRAERQYTVGAGSLFHRTTAYSVPIDTTSERYMSAPAGTASLLDATGSLTATGGYSAQTHVWLPLAVLGRPVTPMVGIGVFGASIEDGSGDGSGVGASSGGYMRRALYNVDGAGTKVARVNLAVPSESAGRFLLAGSKRREIYPYLTHAIFGYGGNDYSLGTTLSDMQARHLDVWSGARAGGVPHISQVSMSPKTTSTDSWATVANQTPRTGWDVATGEWYAYNESLASIVATNPNVDGYLDLWDVEADATFNDRWKASSTADGTHPNATMSASMAAATRIYIQSLIAAHT